MYGKDVNDVTTVTGIRRISAQTFMTSLIYLNIFYGLGGRKVQFMGNCFDVGSFNGLFLV